MSWAKNENIERVEIKSVKYALGLDNSTTEYLFRMETVRPSIGNKVQADSVDR